LNVAINWYNHHQLFEPGQSRVTDNGMAPRGALIGCGFFAQNHLHAWRDLGANIVAVADIDGDKARATAAAHGIAKFYSDAEAMLAAEKPDFVDIATTVATHRPLVELAARYGAAIICQKPFATNLADADAMIDACERAHVPLMVHENFRWRTPMIAVRDAISSGAIGTPFFGRFSCRHDYDIYANQPYLAEVERFAILDVGIHLLDLARCYFGEVESLACATQRVNPIVKGEDVATIMLKHVSGATSIVDASFFTHAHPTPFPETTVEIDGSSGAVRILEGYRMQLTSGNGPGLEKSVEPSVAPWMSKPWHDVQTSVVNIQRHWLERLGSGGLAATSGVDNRKTLQLGLLAYDAAASGRTIRVAG
jgi:predicted dehydrogenase